MPTIAEVVRHMAVSTRSRRIRTAGSEDLDLLTLARGVFLERSYLESFAQVWERNLVVDLARIRAAVLRSRSGGVVHGESAALLHGLPVHDQSGDVHLWTPHPPRTSASGLPAVRLPDGTVFPARRIIGHQGWLPPGGSVLLAGIPSLTLEATAITAAMTLPEERGFVITCGALNRLSRFERSAQDRCRPVEARVRAELVATVSLCPERTRGRARARRVLGSADAGCESVGEARLLAILKAAGIRGLVTQVVTTCGSTTYYVDIGIPGILLAIEFDGLAKYGDERGDIHRGYLARDRRQREIEGLGVSFLRFTWADLDHPEQVVAVVRERISRLSAGARRGSGAPDGRRPTVRTAHA